MCYQSMEVFHNTSLNFLIVRVNERCLLNLILLIGLTTCQVHQMSVTWISGNFGASGNFGSGGIASGAVVTVGTASDGHHPNLPLNSCRWGNSVPIHTFLPSVLPLNWGLVVPGPGALSLWGILG